MKPLWQQQQQRQQQMQRQQEQMRKQQEQMRRQQMGAAWMEQQKAKARKGQPDVLPQGREWDRFAQVEGEVARLRQEMVAGRLSEEQFKARLRELMVQDGRGNWWMIGYETGKWYLHDGTNWVRADPPGSVALRAAPRSVAQPVAPVKTKPRRFWGIVVFLLGLAITFGAGLGVGSLTAEIENEVLPFITAGIVWLGGLIYSIRWARKVWRRE